MTEGYVPRKALTEALEENERLKGDLWYARSQIAWIEPKLAEAESRLAELETRAQEAVEALGFYAKQKGIGAVLASDGGMRARTAIAKWEGEKA